ncbi:MAG: OmpA family protein [Alphaproteobacteria bacterium]|nr:OmpA family protein [Alphaproteobacteria bacterium]
MAPGGASLTLPFAADSAALSNEARQALTELGQRMGREDAIHVVLQAYAAGGEDTAYLAKRLSLSRALTVRSFLMDQGVRSTRIEVRALGNRVPNGPADRVDLMIDGR